MFRSAYSIILFASILLTGCGSDSEGTESFEDGTTIWVNSRLVDCVGEGPQKCMQIKDSEKGDWKNFYGKIARFRYEEGYFYELRVRISEVADPPAGGSSLRYEMLELVSMRQDPEQRLYKARPDLYEMHWRLKSYTKPDGDVVRVDNNLVVTLEVAEESGQVTGIAACNSYFGQADINGNAITIDKIGTSRQSCPEEGAMEMEQLYIDMLDKVVRIQPAKSVFLTMILSDGAELLFIPGGRKEGM